MQSGDCARRCCGTDGCVASLTRGRAIVCGLVLPIRQRLSTPKAPLSLSLCVSVDTSTPRGRNLSITSLRHVPGPIHSSEKRDERVVANGQRRHVDAGVVPEAEFLLPTRDAGVKMRWMDRNVSFDCSIFFSSFSSSPRDRRRGKIKLSVMSDRGKWDDRYQVSRQKRVFLSRENREIVSIF